MTDSVHPLPRPLLRWRLRPLHWLVGMALGAGCCAPALAAHHARGAQRLPAAVQAALQQAQVPTTALSAMVVSVVGEHVRLSYRAQAMRQPASVMKLFTTYAALDKLGPAYEWRTPVGWTGPIQDGVLQGSLVLQGRGDPSLVMERVWLMLQRVRSLGVQRIAGDIVIDHSAFVLPPGDAGDFDGEPLRPYNVMPDAFLVNYKSLTLRFTPLPGAGTAHVAVQPALQGIEWPQRVALNDHDCGEWREALGLDLSDPSRPQFRGSYPAACGESEWPLAWPQPRDYASRAIAAMWQALGGQLQGSVHEGPWPAGLSPGFEFTSPPLAQVVRDINKFSNNLMARQLFLTLGLELKGQGTLEASRAAVQEQALERAHCDAGELVIDNGSGLSRADQTSAACLTRLLLSAWGSPVMPELLASLPVAGVDGTAKHARNATARAHLKTGSLHDVAAVAGVVLGDSGRRYVVVGLINDANAANARPALDALVGWAAHDQSR